MNANEESPAVGAVRRWVVPVLFTTASSFPGQAAHAANAAGTMTVTATVAASCVVTTATLSFSSTSSATIRSDDTDLAGSVTVNCTTGSGYTLALDKGSGTGATMENRIMTSGVGGHLLNYTIFNGATRTTVWGDGTGATSTVAATGTGAGQIFPAYSRIFAGQNVYAGSYSDAVNVTVTY